MDTVLDDFVIGEIEQELHDLKHSKNNPTPNAPITARIEKIGS